MANPDWQEYVGPGGASIPAASIDGGLPGPTWLFTGGVHGDEYEGPEAIRRAAARLSRLQFPGKVLAVPVVNAMAYSRGVRCTPEDGGNLNRVFPGRRDASLTYQWAAWFWETFVERADRLVDLHAGGAAYEFEPVCGFYYDEDKPLAATMELTLWRAPDTVGVFSREFRKRRGPALGAELGFGGVRNEDATLSAAASLIQLATGHLAKPIGPVYSHLDVLSSAGGEWGSAVRLGQTVRQGQTLGVVTNWRGETLETITAPAAGRVLAFRRLRSVPANDLVVVIGIPEAEAIA